ncbi:Predicted nucleotidyltransferase [Modicisalibacter ilicicola DSM 19980]|uniref:Predicted nucleotidyltransferase n=1 Tax=Modicisalibacter ilicicola DSM 19980 TaxID=1121942 RepID=A0A1M4ZDK3_9GAMM|nr:nucleotidyltransferase domain-containing protein [Halomonas ilicicola]SHF16048.1 Predicted nucleotidyltransferase [Halomonas ilicicola DSM 19980]
MPLEPLALERCLQRLREQLPELQAVYLFGSEASGHAGSASDVDLAVLLPTPLSATVRWTLMDQLAEIVGRDVDLVDLRGASTVMQRQVLEGGQRLWANLHDADEFELSSLSEYWDLTIKRRQLIDDIKQRGRIHG